LVGLDNNLKPLEFFSTKRKLKGKEDDTSRNVTRNAISTKFFSCAFQQFI
jgi:hypothetical protein